MYILAIETTGQLASVALLNAEDGAFVGMETSPDQMNHLRDLIPMTDTLLKRLNVAKSELAAVAASMGPGSFTGVRIGVATARAIAQSLSIKCIAVPTLEAFMLKESAQQNTMKYKTNCAILNARRGQVYGMVQGEMPAGPYMLDDVLEVVTNDVLPNSGVTVFYGDGVDAYRQKIEDTLECFRLPDGSPCYEFADEADRYQDAKSVGKYAYALYKSGFVIDYEDLKPDYMRLSEAEQKLAAGELAISKMKQE